MENYSLGERIRKLRIRLGYSQFQLATHLGVSIQAISNWETGKSNPEISILVPLANLLNVGTDELLGNQKIRKDWEDRWQIAIANGGHSNALRVAEEALQHLPGDRLFRFRRANEEYMTAAISDDVESRKKLLASSVQHFSDILKEYPDYEEAGIMLVQTLIVLDREAEAKEIADRLPYKDKLQLLFRHGEKRKQQLQKLTEKAILELLNLLLDQQNWKAMNIAKAVLDAVDSDEKLIYYRLNQLSQYARLYQNADDSESVLNCFEEMCRIVLTFEAKAQTPSSNDTAFLSYPAGVPSEEELKLWVLEAMERSEFAGVSTLPRYQELIRCLSGSGSLQA